MSPKKKENQPKVLDDESRDAVLQQWFAESEGGREGELAPDDFVACVAQRSKGAPQLGAMSGWRSRGVLVACCALFGLCLMPAQGVLASIFATTLFSIENAVVAQVLLPLNSVGTLLGFGILIAWRAYRKIAA